MRERRGPPGSWPPRVWAGHGPGPRRLHDRNRLLPGDDHPADRPGPRITSSAPTVRTGRDDPRRAGLEHKTAGGPARVGHRMFDDEHAQRRYVISRSVLVRWSYGLGRSCASRPARSGQLLAQADSQGLVGLASNLSVRSTPFCRCGSCGGDDRELAADPRRPTSREDTPSRLLFRHRNGSHRVWLRRYLRRGA